MNREFVTQYVRFDKNSGGNSGGGTGSGNGGNVSGEGIVRRNEQGKVVSHSIDASRRVVEKDEATKKKVEDGEQGIQLGFGQ